MTLVLDTNVLASGLLKGGSAPGMIVRLIAAGQLRVVYDARILAEYREVLSRPRFGIKKKEIDELLLQIEKEGVHVTAKPSGIELPDPGGSLLWKWLSQPKRKYW